MGPLGLSIICKLIAASRLFLSLYLRYPASGARLHSARNVNILTTTLFPFANVAATSASQKHLPFPLRSSRWIWLPLTTAWLSSVIRESLYPTNVRNPHCIRNWKHFWVHYPPQSLFNQPRLMTSHVFSFGKTKMEKLKSMFPSAPFSAPGLKNFASAPRVSRLELLIVLLAN